ncbi:restriction endonuclease [Actinoplanes sp. NPDC049548]|uniref:nSTAND3 domain-containing NTPase n=1 Tax=Actinoplanes sp. NPDC049548 TaxID=3155152 RepID=UPI003443C841
MDGFDLARLTDVDFEAVCKDLFEDLLGVRLEIFAPGADQGIDLRHLGSDGHRTVVQCKHWIKAGRAALIRHLAQHEAAKVRRLDPARYVLATSVDLTPQSKAAIVQALAPYGMREGDIFGLRELESELRKRPELVRRHLRLWLTSAGVLDSLLSREIVVRSAALAAEIEETSLTYVPNASFDRAMKLLESKHVCVISGIPGIGKTTLAHVVLAAHRAAGFEIVEVSEDAEEANRLWDEAVPQVFYYDDFLGQTTLEDKLHKNEDVRIISLLRRSSRSAGKRFVLTTREYILAQARARYEKLASQDFDTLGCVLDLADYTPLIRAEILYNHLYFSRLGPRQRAYFAAPEAYWPIIRHKNFNPRLVSATIDAFVDETFAPQEVFEAILENLTRPMRLWAHIVEEQLGESDVHVLLCLLLFGGSARTDELQTAWTAYRRHLAAPVDLERMRRSLRVLDGTVTRGADSVRGRPGVVFHNPSIRDYMGEYVRERPDVFLALVASAVYYDQIAACRPLLRGLRSADTALVAELRRSLVARSIEMMDESAPATRYHSELDKLTTLLLVSEDFDLAELSDHVAGRLDDGTDVFASAGDPDDVAQFVRAVESSHEPRVRDHAARLAGLAVKDALGDLGSWDGCLWAEAVLDGLAELAPRAAVEEVEAAKMRLAIREFEWWSEGDGPLDSEIFDFAESFSDPEAVFPQFDLVRRAHGTRTVLDPPASHAGTAHASTEEMNERIIRMFSSLGRDAAGL